MIILYNSYIYYFVDERAGALGEMAVIRMAEIQINSLWLWINSYTVSRINLVLEYDLRGL